MRYHQVHQGNPGSREEPREAAAKHDISDNDQDTAQVKETMDHANLVTGIDQDITDARELPHDQSTPGTLEGAVRGNQGNVEHAIPARCNDHGFMTEDNDNTVHLPTHWEDVDPSRPPWAEISDDEMPNSHAGFEAAAGTLFHHDGKKDIPQEPPPAMRHQETPPVMTIREHPPVYPKDMQEKAHQMNPNQTRQTTGMRKIPPGKPMPQKLPKTPTFSGQLKNTDLIGAWHDDFRNQRLDLTAGKSSSLLHVHVSGNQIATIEWRDGHWMWNRPRLHCLREGNYLLWLDLTTQVVKFLWSLLA